MADLFLVEVVIPNWGRLLPIMVVITNWADLLQIREATTNWGNFLIWYTATSCNNSANMLIDRNMLNHIS